MQESVCEREQADRQGQIHRQNGNGCQLCTHPSSLSRLLAVDMANDPGSQPHDKPRDRATAKDVHSVCELTHTFSPSVRAIVEK